MASEFQGDVTLATSGTGGDSSTANIINPSQNKDANVPPILKMAFEMTTTTNLVLLAYLIWYFWILFAVGAASKMTASDFEDGLIAGLFIGILLNFAAYPKGSNVSFKDYCSKDNAFRIARFFIIPFCVSTISIACAEVNNCHALFPTDGVSLFLLIFIMVGVVIFGKIVNRIGSNVIDEAKLYAK